MNSTFGDLTFYIIPLFVFGMGTLGILYPQYLAWRWGKKSRRWPRAHGKITHSGVTRYRGKGPSYAPEIEYEYVVNQQRYTGKRIEFGLKANTTKDQAREDAAKYSVGRKVTVRYHPDNPKLSTLRSGISNGRLAFGFVLSTIVGGMELAWIVAVIRPILAKI